MILTFVALSPHVCVCMCVCVYTCLRDGYRARSSACTHRNVAEEADFRAEESRYGAYVEREEGTQRSSTAPEA